MDNESVKAALLRGLEWTDDGYPKKTVTESMFAAHALITRLEDKCNMQANILRRLTPDKFPDTLFIHGTVGDKDYNGMPEMLLVVPAYGVDFSYVYERTDRVTGPEW